MRTPEAVASMPDPVCKIGLAVAEGQGIETDLCPTRRGSSLRRGELDRIIDRNLAAGAPTPARWSGGHRGGHDPCYGKKRKKSLPEELFD